MLITIVQALQPIAEFAQSCLVVFAVLALCNAVAAFCRAVNYDRGFMAEEASPLYVVTLGLVVLVAPIPLLLAVAATLGIWGCLGYLVSFFLAIAVSG